MKKLPVPFNMPYDKWLHLLVGTMLGVWLIPNIGLGLGFGGFVIVAAVAMLKEFYDYISPKGTPDKLDVVFTLIVPFFILIIHLIVS